MDGVESFRRSSEVDDVIREWEILYDFFNACLQLLSDMNLGKD